VTLGFGELPVDPGGEASRRVRRRHLPDGG
jgi:hypothetical protein